MRRGDIDGLRAIAIAAVLVFHAFPHALPGGYAGVDVFFVVSGYLISRIILADDFSFATFYARRVRRIVPALAIVLAAVLVAGWFVLLADEYAALGKHVVGGAGFAANLVLWSEVGYFDKAAATKPLLHLWSLGIEEQFYLVWPLLLWIGRRWMIPFAFAASFAAAIAWPAFYAPWTRMWELLVGAALARWTPPKVPAIVGLVLIAASCAVRLDGALMIVPTVGTAIVIATGAPALAHPVLTWLGRISFPLYLWHWPLLVFAALLGHSSIAARLIIIAASIGLADLTYRLVERPIQRGRLHVVAIAAALVIVGAAGVVVMRDGFPDRAAAQRAPDFVAFAFGSSEACKQAHPYAGSCFASAHRHAHAIALIGDSHGDALGAGMIHTDFDRDLLMLTHPDCLPLIGGGCLDAAYPDVAGDPRIDVVVLVARYMLRVPQLRQALVATLTALRGKRVIFVDQVPELGFDPRTCVSRTTGERTACSLPRAEVDARQQPYRAIADQVLAGFPNAVRVDPLPLFCTAQVCSAWRDGEMMYHDADHLSPRGAVVLAAAIARKLAQLE